MGRGTSRLDHQKGGMLPKLPPLLSRKLEEIRRRRAGATLSKKQLLKDGYEDDNASIQHNDGRSVSSPELDEDSIGSAKVAPEPTEPEQMFSDQQVVAREKSTVQDNNKDKEEDEEKVEEAVTATLEKLALEETEDEEYGRSSNVEDSLICPRSPSFRVYYLESLRNKEDDGNGYYMNKGSLSDTDVDVVEIVESTKLAEESVDKIKKRGRKGMKFRRVGKPVKNFLNVKSCYYPSCGGSTLPV